MVAFFTRHPTAANLLLLFLCVLGLSALPGLQRETFPDFDAALVQVQVIYPGASPAEVEEAICQRVEDAVDGIADVEEMRCEAREGVASAMVEMSDGGDFERFMSDVKSEVEAIDNFPQETEIPIVQELNRTDRVVSVAITGPEDAVELKAYAQQIKDRMQRLPEIAQVNIGGFSQQQLVIEIPAAALQRYGLGITDVADAVSRQGTDLPVGTLETPERNLLLRFTDLRRTPAELAELVVVGGDNGGEIRLGDIAQIRQRFEVEEEKILLDGRRAAVLQVVKTKQQDTLKVMDQVQAFVEEARAGAPPGVTFTLTENVSSIVSDRLGMLMRNGLQGLVLVFLVMWLFFQGRFAFWVAAGLPVSFLGALFLMQALGLTINMITMVALLIAIGLLMDDAIVISENIATQMRRGKDAFQAAIDGAKEVAPGVVSSFLTSVAVFAPLAFLEGHLGKVLQFIPMVLILVLAVSLVEAFLILPHHLAHSFSAKKEQQSRFRRGFDDALFGFRDRVAGPVVDAAVRHRYWFMGAVVGFFLLSIGLLAGGKVKFQAFPDIEGDIVEARLMLPQGTPLGRTEAVVERLTAAAEAMNQEFADLQPAGERLVRNIQVRFNQNRDVGETGPHVATVTLDLLTAERRGGRMDDFIAAWRQRTGDLPDVVSLTFKEPTRGPGGVPIEIRLSGDSLEQLDQASAELQDWLARYAGVSDLDDDLRPGKPELRLRLREGALALGVDAARAAQQLRAAFYGSVAAEIQVGRESYEILMRVDAQDLTSLRDLEAFRVMSASGHLVPLSTVAETEEARGYSRIQRVDGVRTITVTGDLDARKGNAQEIIGHTQANFLPQLIQKYPEVRFSIEGEAKRSAKTGGSMLSAFGIGLAGIFILLSFQFRSYLEPVVVMSLIPLALTGVIWGHFLLGLNLSMPGMIGFASLAGVVVNDSILLVEFLKRGVRAGLGVAEAARAAGRARFRAVMLTSITTIAGLLPLLLEKSLQAQVLIPLAASIVFGLLASTLLVLLVVPALYTIFDDLKITSLARERRAEAV